MNIVWLEDAASQLIQIIDDIHVANPSAANAAEQRICASISHLSQFPEAGRIGRVPGTRELVIVDLPYIVVYRLHSAQVQILTIRHTSRLWPN